MSSVTAVILLVLLALPAASEGKVEGRGATRRFISQKYGFSMAVPEGWGVSVRLDTPVFAYAPPSERFIQDSIPKSGAVITVESHDSESGQARSATTPETWASADIRAFGSGSPTVQPFQFPIESAVTHAVVCSYDEPTFSPDQQPEHSVAIFWEFDKGLFAAHLRYNANDSNAPVLQKVYFQTVRSIRPLAKP